MSLYVAILHSVVYGAKRCCEASRHRNFFFFFGVPNLSSSTYTNTKRILNVTEQGLEFFETRRISGFMTWQVLGEWGILPHN